MRVSMMITNDMSNYFTAVLGLIAREVGVERPVRGETLRFVPGRPTVNYYTLTTEADEDRA